LKTFLLKNNGEYFVKTNPKQEGLPFEKTCKTYLEKTNVMLYLKTKRIEKLRKSSFRTPQ
jgi:hypothetical protein